MALTGKDGSVLTFLAESVSDRGEQPGKEELLSQLSEEAKPIGLELFGVSSGSSKAKKTAKAIRNSVQENRKAARARSASRSRS